MVKTIFKILSIAIFALIVFSVDYIFFRHLFWEKLLVNLIIFIVFLALFIKYINK